MFCAPDRDSPPGALARHLHVPADGARGRRSNGRRFGADIVRNGRRALMRAVGEHPPTAMPVPRPQPSDDDLVELMAQALVRAVRFDALDLDDALAVETGLIRLGFAPLDAGRDDIVAPATARARVRLRGGALLDHAGLGAAFGSLLLAATMASCLISSPARAAAVGALLTDERLFSFFTWAPFLIVGLLVLAFCWRERGTLKVTGDEAGAPDLADIEARRRAADHG